MQLKEAKSYPRVYLYRRIVQAKLFIDANYNRKIELDEISGEAFFSKFHFIRLFKKIYGKTPHQYLKFLRIEKAKQLLQSGSSVSDTCYAVGFESPGSFSSLFKLLVGKSPSDYFLETQRIKSRMMETPLQFVPSCFASKSASAEKRNFEEVRI